MRAAAKDLRPVLLIGPPSLPSGFRHSGPWGKEKLESINAHEFLDYKGDKTLNKLKTGYYQSIWIEVPRANDIKHSSYAFWHKLAITLDVAHQNNTAVVVCTDDADRPSITRIDSLAAKYHMLSTEHHWCFWGIHRGDNISKKKTKVYTTSHITLSDHPCICSGKPAVSSDTEMCAESGWGFWAHARFARHISASINLNLTTSTALPSGLSTDAALNVPDSQDFETHLSSNAGGSTQIPPEPPPGLSHTTVSAYPTDSKEKERNKKNELKAQGIDTKALVKKQKKYIEPHFDDCGDDLSSITTELYAELSSSSDEPPWDELEASSDEDDIGHTMTNTFMCGTWDGDDGAIPLFTDSAYQAQDLDELLAYLESSGPGLDIVELCGGEGRSSKVAVRRHLGVGNNFDIVTGTDLNDPVQQRKVLKYINTNNVLVAIMAPTCAPFGPISSMMKANDPAAWERSYARAAPHGRFCGEVALNQLKKGRHFINEQPFPSKLYLEEPWPQVLQHPNTRRIVWDRCQTGCRGPSGKPARKRSCMIASHEALTKPFENHICPGRHIHDNLEHGRSKPCQLWTWEEASLVISGVKALKRALGKASAYPTMETQTSDDPPPEPTGASAPKRTYGTAVHPKESEITCEGCIHKIVPHELKDAHTLDRNHCRWWWRKCEGCLWRRPAEDIKHTHLHDSCKFPNIPVGTNLYPDCPGCCASVGRDDTRHRITEPGKCRYADIPSKAGVPRSGGAPRSARIKATYEPTQDLRVSGGGKPEMGAKEERENEARASPSASSEAPSSEAAARPAQSREEREQRIHEGAGTPFTKQPGGTREAPPTFADASAQSSPSGANWLDFDIGRITRSLRVAKPAEQRRTLRKLHVRWWHAPVATMVRLLKHAGLPPEVTNQVDSIVDTCACCRKWTRPLPESVASVEIAEKFNVQVEADLVFYKKYTILHVIDRATRWYAAIVVGEDMQGKRPETLVDAFDKIWTSVHGPPKELICDNEGGLCKADLANDYWQRHGINFHARAVNQHARFIERRGELVKHTMRKMDAQLESEGISVPIERRLGEAVFASNALISVNGSTPYNAVYGRVPHMLPDLSCYPDVENDGSNRDEQGGLPGTVRHSHRLREIAIQQMVAGTAAQRIGRVLNTRTLVPVQHMNYKVGDQVEYYKDKDRPKDTPGWHGPATIVDTTQSTRGSLGIRHGGVVLPNVALRNIRPYESFLALLAGDFAGYPHQRAQNMIIEAITRLPTNQTLTLGTLVSAGHQKVVTPAASNRTHHSTLAALNQLAETGLALQNCVAYRIGHGVPRLYGVNGFHHSLVMYWHSSNMDLHSTIVCDADKDVDLKDAIGNRWETASFIQFLCVHDEDAQLHEAQAFDKDAPKHADSSAKEDPAPRGSLTPITEGSCEDGTEDSYLMHDDPELHAAVRAAIYHMNTETDSQRQAGEDGSLLDLPYYPAGADIEVPIVENYHTICANVRAGLPPNYELEFDTGEAEIEFPWPFSKLVTGLPRSPLSGETVYFKVQQPGIKKAVIERDTDNLTKAEELEHKEEMAAAILKELQTWQHYKCFSRRSRQTARNIIDSRWVTKWKWVKMPDGKDRRVIRARLCVRGFKDRDAGNLESYAGTAQRYSQRIVVSEAVRRGWDISTADVEKAFLQGVTYEELSRLTGEPLREVNFMPPTGSIPILQKIEGFSGFDPRTEVCHCDKPGTGLVDAPRAFSMKLAEVTRKCGMNPTTVDAELVVKHVNGKLVAIVAKHVDDLKIAGEPEVVQAIMKELEAVFGELKLIKNDFTNCGVRHIQDPVTKEIELDQDEYLKALKCVRHPDLVKAPAESSLSSELHTLYMSSLGAVAYLAMTRLDAAVFIVALQKHTHAPLVIHQKRLNALILWLQRNPKHIKYKRFKSLNSHLRIVSDAAFRKEDDDAHALKGAIIIRCEGNMQSLVTEAATGVFQHNCHIIDYYCRKQRHVTRSTFGAELYAACDAVDFGMLIIQLMQELEHGVDTFSTARQRRENGDWKIDMVAAVDAMSVYAAVTAGQLKIPTEKSLWSHIQYLRELLDTGVLRYLLWIDTRDMWSDGLTKGSVERTLIHELMQGLLHGRHPYKAWAPKMIKPAGSPDCGTLAACEETED